MNERHSAGDQALSFLLNLRGRGIRDTALLRAFEIVKRSSFIDRRYHDLAGSDVSLPIECGQTQTAPSMLARMFNLLEIRSTNRVLEIGTGSGYGTAILANLAGEVVSVERFQSLVLAARTRLANSSLENVTIILDDGCNGNASNGPFDRILLSGSILSVPESLIRQLAPEGILVCVVSGSGIPLLCRYRKGINAAPEPEIIGPFHLSPLITGISTIL